jgi:hypothetical protein
MGCLEAASAVASMMRSIINCICGGTGVSGQGLISRAPVRCVNRVISAQTSSTKVTLGGCRNGGNLQTGITGARSAGRHRRPVHRANWLRQSMPDEAAHLGGEMRSPAIPRGMGKADDFGQLLGNLTNPDHCQCTGGLVCA